MLRLLKSRPKGAGYKVGQTGKTRDGRPYRILAVDSRDSSLGFLRPIIAEVGYDRGTHMDWSACEYDAEGYSFGPSSPHSIDLDKVDVAVQAAFVVVVWRKSTGEYLRTTTSLAADDPSSPQNRGKPEFADEIGRMVGGERHLIA